MIAYIALDLLIMAFGQTIYLRYFAFINEIVASFTKCKNFWMRGSS